MVDPKDDWLNPDHYEDVDIDDPENPEWTAEDFANARPFKEVFPELYAQWEASRKTDVTPPKPAVRKRA